MKKMVLKQISIPLFAFLFIMGMTSVVFASDSDQGTVFYTKLQGTINNSLANDFENVLKEAENSHATVFIIEIDTFGGRLDSAVKIKDLLIDTGMETIVFVNKKAISAGALITLASKHIVMAPGSTIGAATPVRLTHWEEKPASEKVISYFRKEMKSTAEAKSHPAEIAEAMVDPSVRIEGVSEAGKLLTLTTKEALELGVADLEARNLDELLKNYNIRIIDIEKRPIPWTEKVSKLTSESNRLFNSTLIWFLAGLILIILEFMVPGVILIFFGIGAWIVSLTSFLKVTTSLESQLLGFIIASILLLVFLRRWIKGKFYGHVSDVQNLNENMDEFTGKRVLVLQNISPGELGGQVEFKGSTWKAVSEEHIKEGEFTTILGVDGITLRVGTVKEGE